MFYRFPTLAGRDHQDTEAVVSFGGGFIDAVRRREADDLLGLARALGSLGTEAVVTGDLTLARSYHEELVTVCRGLGNKQRIADSLSSLANTVRNQGDLALARTLAEEGLETCIS